MRKQQPSFIGIGVPHAGLGQVASWLAAHPQIADSVPVMNFFNTSALSKKGHAWYEETLQRHAAPEQRWGEVSPNYITNPAVAAAIASAYPDTKLFVVLRHPVHRVLAEYRATAQYDARVRQQTVEAFLGSTPAALARSMYSEMLESFFAYNSPQTLHILWYEDVANSPLVEIQKLYHFLGVDKTFVPKALEAFAPPPEEPKNPGPIKRNLHRLALWRHRRLVESIGHVFPRDEELVKLLPPTVYQQLGNDYLPMLDKLSQQVSLDTVSYWRLRD